ncbi:MAG TPA: hypothetical protein VJ804_13665, partial [Acidimicrobiales bacterium]|nr:hypothetical protein [Acidimicrobiales bacterium]
KPSARPMAINDHGIIVGSSGWPAPVPGRDAVAWVYGTIVPIATNADALDISDANGVVGCQGGSEGDDDGRRPFVAQLPGEPVLLPTEAASPAGCALSVTSWGAVGGYQRTTPDAGLPTLSGVLWFQGQALEYTGTPHHITEVRRVAENGFVLLRLAPTGSPTQPTHSAIGAPGGQYFVLDPLSAGSSATDLNDHGLAVGNRLTEGNGSGSEPFPEPVLWVYGSTVSLVNLVASADTGKVAAGVPVALSETNIIAGNTGAASWLMRPPS